METSVGRLRVFWFLSVDGWFAFADFSLDFSFPFAFLFRGVLPSSYSKARGHVYSYRFPFPSGFYHL